MTECDSLTKFNAAAKEFAAQHVTEIARDLNQWQDTGLLPDECKLRDLNLLCFKISPFNSAMLAESIANRACRDAAALAQPVAASDVQVPNTFKLPGESDEAWVGRITWPAGTPEPVFVYSGQSGRELEDLLEGYDFGTAFYTSPPAAQPVAAEPSIEDLCARIKAADDAAADNDYMLDSDDCIRVLRGTWKGPLAMDKPDPPTPA